MLKVGILGSGLMGKPMAWRLFKANFPLIVYNRTSEKLIPLKDEGIKVTSNPEDAIAFSDCLILMLTNTEAIEMVLLNSKADLTNKTFIQMGTISPSESKYLQGKINQLGGNYFEAPVLGSIPEVKSGKLLIMVGGSESQFKQFYSLLKNLSPQPMLIGEVGTASALKLALNQLIAGLTSSFALSLSFVQKQGVNLDKFMTILRESALYAPTFDKKLNRMCEHNFANPNFPTKHLLKDVDLFLTQAEELGLDTSSLQGIRQVIAKAIELGLSDRDYSALFAAIEPTKT
jgi:3-hydroxyisobutyrate dehydrogenase